MGIKAHELRSLINICYEGVETSKVGPIYLKNTEGKEILDDKGNPLMNNIAYHTFMYLIQALAPKNFSMGVKEEK